MKEVGELTNPFFVPESSILIIWEKEEGIDDEAEDKQVANLLLKDFLDRDQAVKEEKLENHIGKVFANEREEEHVFLRV